MRTIFCVLWCFVYQNLYTRCSSSPTSSVNIDGSDKLWFTQKLDHFNLTDDRTWLQKYNVNSKFYQSGGPVFLMIGGEEAISDYWIQNGTWIKLAKKFNALCFHLEHRYYGESQPTIDLSTDNLVYLSSEQALADVAKFIINVHKEFKETSKVITFGGSYAGSLSAWMRLKYPEIVYAAVSSSAPLLAKVDFNEYFDGVVNSLAAYSTECVNKFRQANKIIRSYMPSATNILDDTFELCEPLNYENKKEVANFYEILASNVAQVVQHNDVNRYYENPEKKLVNIPYICDIMTDDSVPHILNRYAKLSNKLLSLNGEKCLNIKYNSMIERYSMTSWTSSIGARQWMYQTCTEFGYFQTSNQSIPIFNNYFPVKFYLDMCTDIFGQSFDSTFVSNAVEKTNTIYGGLDIKADRIIYVHGSIDPWKALGITQTTKIDTKAILINGAAHCADMYSSTETDSPQLIEARNIIETQLNQWLEI